MRGRGRDIGYWQVAFYGQPRGALERLIFRPGFRHCIAFAWIETDRWLMIDPALSRQAMQILTGPQYVRAMAVLDRAHATVVKAEAIGSSRRVPRIATCAGVIAHLLGVRGALLPHGLYRALATMKRE